MTMGNQMAPGPPIGPQQASNMLLNQALGPMTATQIRGQQQLSQQMGQPMAGNPQMMQQQQMIQQQQMNQQQQMSQQGGGPMGMQPTRVRAPMNVTMGTPQLQSQVPQQQQGQGGNFDRQQNSHTINQLEAMLAEAKRKEMTYQLQNPNQQGQMGPVQMVPQQQQPMVPQQQQQPMVPQQAQGMGQQPPIRQQLQAHLQSAQHQRMAMNQPQMQQTPTGVTANPQLKHLYNNSRSGMWSRTTAADATVTNEHEPDPDATTAADDATVSDAVTATAVSDAATTTTVSDAATTTDETAAAVGSDGFQPMKESR